MVSFIGRHWRGESSFWWAVLVFTLALPAAAITAALAVTSGSLLLTPPMTRMGLLTALCALVGSVAIWQLVGTWRVSSKTRQPQRWWITRWAARGLAIFVAGMGLLMTSALPQAINALYIQATDQDEYGRLGYTVSVDGANLIINGYFAWGLLDEVERALTANPEVQMVVLNSLGGHVGVGKWLYEAFKARGFDTYVDEKCASACILAFMAGSNRYLERDAKLGFHGVIGEAENMRAAAEATIIAIYRETGAPEDFISRTIQTPGSEVWVPKQKELVAANIVTEIVN